MNAPRAPSDAEMLSCPPFVALDAGQRACLARHLKVVSVATGATVVRRGETDRSVYFIVRGCARATRDGIDLGGLAAGDHFGELGLVAGRARAASVVATTDLLLLQLDHAGYVDLVLRQPEVAVRTLEVLVGGVGSRLEAMTDSVGVLLRDRSAPRRAEVRVVAAGEARVVRSGVAVRDLLPAAVGGVPVVAALVNQHVAPLGWPIASPCTVDPLTSAHWEGQDIVRHSLALLVLEAGARVAPSIRMVMGYSVGFGRRIDVLDPPPHGLTRLAEDLQRALDGLVAADGAAREEWWTVDEARDFFAERGWRGAADLLRTWHQRTVPVITYGDVYALGLTPLVDRAHLLAGGAILADTDGLLLQYPRDITARSRARRPAGDGNEVTDPGVEMRAVSRQTTDMTHGQERWLRALGVESVGAFNEACVRGEVGPMIRVAEGFQERRIIDIADQIQRERRQGRGRIVSIAGPSSSGKTTFIRRLKVQLQVAGLHPVEISLDNYYVDCEATPRDSRGQYDFEALNALNLSLLSDHMARVLAGERVATARYDFHTGRSHPEGGEVVQLGDGGVLMLEGIHGLNPQLLPASGSAEVFTIFICPLAQLPFDRLSRVKASDVRLIRRIVRDRHTRNHNARSTIERWPSVRAGERHHIFPYQHLAHAVFDSSLLYELSVLKVFAQRYLLEVPQTCEAYATAARLLHLLDRFVTIYPDHVPPNSLLREFIGTSGFEI